MKRVVAPLTIKHSTISSPTGTVKGPLMSGRSSHGGKGKFKWTIWQNGGGKKKGLRDQYVSKCLRCNFWLLFTLWLLIQLQLPSGSDGADMTRHLWSTVLRNITGIFHIFLISLEVVQVTFLCDNQMWQRQTLVNCSPLGDIGRFWVKGGAN